MRRIPFGIAFLAILVAYAGSVLAEPVITKATAKRSKKGVNVTLKGTIEESDWTTGEELRIQIGAFEGTVDVDRLKYNARKNRYIWKGARGDVVKKAVFDLARRRFQIKGISSNLADYRDPLHLAIDVGVFHAYELDIVERRKKTKFKGTLQGETGGEELGSGTLTTGGGSIVLDEVTITANDGGLRQEADFDAETAALPLGLPANLRRMGPPIDIEMTTGVEGLEEPLGLAFGYTEGELAENEVVVVLHYNDEKKAYEPLTVRDSGEGKVEVESRSFSIFVVAALVLDVFAPSYTVPGFSESTNGWSIRNFGSYFSPGGNCLGMSSYCAWFFTSHASERLFNKYAGTTAEILATRAHLAQSQYWAIKQHQVEQLLGEEKTGKLLKAYLLLFNEPLILVMFSNTGGHACVVYGYDTQGFRFYDVNVVGASQTVPFTGTSFGTYGSYHSFSFVALPSLGRNQDFQSLYDDAGAGFRGSQVVIESPADGAEIGERKTTLRGYVTEPTWNLVSVFVNGARIDDVIDGSGRFSVEVPLSPGENPITVVAGVNIGNQSSWAPGSGVQHIVVNSSFEGADLLVTLTWEQDYSDVDLYVHEPDGEVSWYSSMRTSDGGFLDIDDVEGYGPEHYTVGDVEDGIYKVRVHYYDEDGMAAATGRVSIIINEGKPNQVQRFRTFNLQFADPYNAAPGSTGGDWVDIAEVDVKNGTITLFQQ